MITGESFFITSFINQSSAAQHVAFAAPFPGKMLTLDLDELIGSFICQRDFFLCASQETEIEVAFSKKLGVGLFGGKGFILQKLIGRGFAFAHAGGTLIEKYLVSEEMLSVDTGCLVATTPTIDYDIKFVGGFSNALFGGEGIFLAKLTVPGKVFLQSLPLSRLADIIIATARIHNQGEKKEAAGTGGDLLGDFISGLKGLPPDLKGGK